MRIPRSKVARLGIKSVLATVLIAILAFVVPSVRAAEPARVGLTDYWAKRRELEAKRWPAGEGVDGYVIVTKLVARLQSIAYTVGEGRVPNYSSLAGFDFQPRPPRVEDAQFAREVVAKVQSDPEMRELWDRLMQADRLLVPKRDGVLFKDGHEAGVLGQLGEYCVAEMRLAAAKGDWALFCSGYRHGLVLSTLASMRANSSSLATGFIVSHRVNTELRRTLSREKLNAETLDQLRSHAASHQRGSDRALVFEGLKLEYLDTIQRCFDDNAGGKLSAAKLAEVMGLPVSSIARRVLLKKTDRSSSETTAIELCDAFEDLAAKLPFQRSKESYTRARSAFAKAEADPVLDQVIHAMYLCVHHLDGWEAEMQMTRVAIEVHAFHAAHGRFPRTLADLKGVNVADLYSGQPLLYRLEGENATEGPTLYSVGLNGKDDGGLPPRDMAMYEALRGSSSDGDFVILPIVDRFGMAKTRDP